jgi:sporulation-control protein
MLGAFGVGAPSVDTVLAAPHVRPGQVLAGEVRIKGGDFEAAIEHVALGLVTRAESGEGEGTAEFFRAEVSGPFSLPSGQERTIPFQVTIPWETPISEIDGQPLRGMAIGVRTELAIAKAVDKGDLDLVQVGPLPSQEAVLRALIQLGFQFRSADLEMGRLYGVQQELPFYQEIEFYPPPQYAGQVSELEVTFVAAAHGLEVILEVGKRRGHDSAGRFQVTHEQAVTTDWASEITDWLSRQGGGHRGHYEHGHHDHDERHGHGGMGMGGMVAAGAMGVAGGLVAAEVIDEVGDFFEGEEEEG